MGAGGSVADASDEALVAQLADMMKANPDKDYDNVLRRAKETCKERMLVPCLAIVESRIKVE